VTDRALRSAVVIALDEALPVLAAARRRLSPAEVEREIPLHLTLLFPFAPRDELDEVVPVLAAVAAGHPAFELRLTAIGEFPGVVYAEPEPSAELGALMRAIWAAFPRWPPYGGTYDDPHPHVTLVTPADDRERDLALVALRREVTLPMSTTVEVISVLEEREPDRWGVACELPLGRAASG
jgi:2'-5' RNA ligase